MINSTQDIDSADFQLGTLLLVDKPTGWTSFDVVNKVRWAIRNRLGIKKIKVGHSGTLDPMATGLLLICTGKWTKKLHDLQGLSKQYAGTITLGGETASYDKESDVTKSYPVDHITPESVRDGMKSFEGDIDQLPPMFSAIKVDGKKLYELARKGKTIELKTRPVRIDQFEMTSCNLPDVEFSVDCGTGTYVRSLAHDLGHKLNSGGYLSSLRRTRVGDYQIDDAWDLNELILKIDVNSEARNKQKQVI